MSPCRNVRRRCRKIVWGARSLCPPCSAAPDTLEYLTMEDHCDHLCLAYGCPTQAGFYHGRMRFVVFQVVLRRGDFPTSVECIEIYGASRLKIYEHALLDLTSLARVELHRVDKLTVYPNGLELRKNAALATFSMDSVKKLTLGSYAFSGFWERRATIKIGYVTSLYIRPQAFNFRSVSGGPDLIIEQVKSLDMASRAFNAPFQSLILATSNTKVCRKNTFGHNIRRIEMSRLNMSDVREDCINGTPNLRLLRISNCDLGAIRHRGVHGKISNMKIYDSNVAMLQPNGFQVQVGDLTIEKSNFRSIMTRGLNVVANNSVFLNKVNVSSLHKHALIALEVRKTENDNGSPIHVDSLTISRAEHGSLTFHEAADVEFRRLSVRAPEPPVCPMTRWVRQLTGSEESEPLSPREEQILSMVWRHWLCPGEGQHEVPVTGSPVTDHAGSVTQSPVPEHEAPVTESPETLPEAPVTVPVTQRDGAGDGGSLSSTGIELVVVFVLVTLIIGILVWMYRSRRTAAGVRSRRAGVHSPETKSSENKHLRHQDVESQIVTDSVVRPQRLQETKLRNRTKARGGRQ